MNYFVAKNEMRYEKSMDADTLMKAAPEYYGPRFAAIKELREADDGTGYKRQEFRRVASLVNVPLVMAEKMSNPDFLKDKKKFYAFLDRNPQYITYQRRNNGHGTHKDELALPLSALGIDYPGGPETIEQWDAVEVPLEDAVPTEPTEVPTTTDSAEATE